MRINPAAVLAEAWATFRRDRELLLAVAGVFWFLPSLALALLVPGPPAMPASLDAARPETARWVAAFEHWAANDAGWFLLAGAVGLWGAGTLYALYLDRSRPTLRHALERGVRAWPRLLLLQFLVGLPAAAGLFLVLPTIWILARFLVAGPAVVAERPIGAAAAAGRSLRLTRGETLPLMTLVAFTLALVWLLPWPFEGLAGWLADRPGGANVVAVATVDVLAAAGQSAAALASALIAILVYRQLASIGI